jgi:basic amino acid/polyamine antiporter, APA family
VLVTILDSMNAQLLSGPRITYAMARDGLFFDWAHVVTPSGTPIGALLLHAATALVFLVAIPDFDALVSLTILVIWLAGVLNVTALFLLRRREPTAARPHRMLGYPWTAAILVVGFALLLANMAFDPLGRVAIVRGLVVIGAGVPIYFAWIRLRRATAS